MSDKGRWLRPSSSPPHALANEPMQVQRFHEAFSTGVKRTQINPCSDAYFTASNRPALSAPLVDSHRAVYRELFDFSRPAEVRGSAEMYLRASLETTDSVADDLPESPQELVTWMNTSSERARAAYQTYLAERKEGRSRRFFSNRSHALNFLQAVAPTKLVDGAWLYGVLRYANDPRMAGLAQTYLEELGNGDVTKNHVLLYRQLLASHGLGYDPELPDAYFQQGAIQLALGHCTESMLPEVIGFNLGYEQLPLHLMITAYELNELGLDPYYFTLHITVDNSACGHARKAVEAVQLNASRFPDQASYWKRVRRGFRLNDLGISTCNAIAAFDIDNEVNSIFKHKAAAGAGAHSDYCCLEGKTVNEWLARPEGIPAFLNALESKGWIVRGPNPQGSRFWGLLQGAKAEMFGVFNEYELQVIFDWMRDEASADGLKFDATTAGPRPLKARSFRAQRMIAGSGMASAEEPGQIVVPGSSSSVDQLSPDAHWTPEGLEATRSYVARLRAYR